MHQNYLNKFTEIRARFKVYWHHNTKDILPIQGLTCWKQAFVRSPKRAKELWRTSGMGSCKIQCSVASLICLSHNNVRKKDCNNMYFPWIIQVVFFSQVDRFRSHNKVTKHSPHTRNKCHKSLPKIQHTCIWCLKRHYFYWVLKIRLNISSSQSINLIPKQMWYALFPVQLITLYD